MIGYKYLLLTLFFPRDKETLVDGNSIVFNGKFKGIDYLDFSAVLSAEKSSDD